MVNLTFTPEAIPKITRIGGSGRTATEWENLLDPVRQQPGVSFRVWEYDKRQSAVSRLSSVRERLTKVVPHENWKMVVRLVPDSDPEIFGVYVEYIGVFTPEQIEENAKLHAERSARVRAAREAKAEREAADAAHAAAEAAAAHTAADPTPEAISVVEKARARAAAKAS